MLLPTYTSAAAACGRLQDARNCSIARVRCGNSITDDADADDDDDDDADDDA